ncbi:RCE2 [Symbiodinium sp. CCMP2592]|nr:RCE2 [Symbiodinium sp. CCMP2592]
MASHLTEVKAPCSVANALNNEASALPMTRKLEADPEEFRRRVRRSLLGDEGFDRVLGSGKASTAPLPSKPIAMSETMRLEMMNIEVLKEDFKATAAAYLETNRAELLQISRCELRDSGMGACSGNCRTSLLRVNAKQRQATDCEVYVALTRQAGENHKLQAALSKALGQANLAAERVSFAEVPCIEHARGPDFERLQDFMSNAVGDPVVLARLTLLTDGGPWHNGKDLGRKWSQESRVTELCGTGSFLLGASKAAIQSAGLDVEFEPTTANAESLAWVSEMALALHYRFTFITAEEEEDQSTCAFIRICRATRHQDPSISTPRRMTERNASKCLFELRVCRDSRHPEIPAQSATGSPAHWLERRQLLFVCQIHSVSATQNRKLPFCHSGQFSRSKASSTLA